MFVRKFVYLVQEAFHTLSRHKGITSISVIIMSLSLLMLAVFLLATDNLLRFIGQAQRDMKLYVYASEHADKATIERLRGKLSAMPEVARVVYISRDDALANFRAQLGNDADVLDALETNPLPDAFWVVPKAGAHNRESIASLAGRITQLDGVDEVRYGKQFLDRFTAIVRGIYYVDVVVGFIVILSAVFIISNAVRLTVISRRKSIEILKLVGATNRFITMPFIIEGAFQGGISALLSLVLLFSVTMLSRRFVPDLAFFGVDKAVLYLSICVAIGSLGSFSALRRYLRTES